MPNPNLPINAQYNTYIGARYVPLFANKDLNYQWTPDRQYEPFMVVLYNGNSFTSTTFVPVGIDINNQTYWAETGNYNAQVESYRQLILEYVNTITSVQQVLANRPFVNVKEWGAKGDGFTDDTQAITNCLNSNSAVFFPTGDYLVDADIPCENNYLLGTGKSRIIRKNNNLSNYSIIQLSHGCTIEKMEIVGDRAGHSGTSGEWGVGVDIQESNNYVKDCIVRDCWGDGIYIGKYGSDVSADDVYIINTRVSNCRRNGISVISSDNFFIYGCTIELTNGTAPGAAIDVEPNVAADKIHGTISNCVLKNNENSGITIVTGALTDYWQVDISDILCIENGNGTGYLANGADLWLNNSSKTQPGYVNVNNFQSINSHTISLLVDCEVSAYHKLEGIIITNNMNPHYIVGSRGTASQNLPIQMKFFNQASGNFVLNNSSYIIKILLDWAGINDSVVWNSSNSQNPVVFAYLDYDSQSQVIKKIEAGGKITD